MRPMFILIVTVAGICWFFRAGIAAAPREQAGS